MTSTFAADVPPTPRAGRLASAALLLSASFVLSRILGLLRNSVIAAVFGNHGPIESYFAAFRIPDTIFTLVSGGALASAFIPVFAGLVHSHEEDEAWQVTSSVFNAVCVALAGLALVAFIFAPIIIGLVFGGFSGPRQSMTVDLTRIMLLQPIFLGAAAVISGVLQTYHRFVLTAVAPLIYNVVVIVGALMGHHYGLTGLAWSVVIGALAQVLIQLPGVWPDARWTYRFSLNFDSPHVREVMRLFGPRVVGLAAFQAMLFITYALASYLPGGMIPAINYSWVLIAFPVGALGTAAAQAVFPTLSRLSASEDLATVRYTVNRSLRLILFLALPSAAGLIVLRRPVVNLLYHRGDFTP
ncbi:MAG: murein biosynthesis integral membrane protein MurJ, partial [Chloroflexota bacterium]